MTVIPVEVGQLRRHPKGYTLRVMEFQRNYWPPCALCEPDPPVEGRRTTSIRVKTLATFKLVTPTTEPTP